MNLRVLFVDDEPNILEALQRMLRPLRAEWEMRFAQGGAAALARLAESPADVLVTDMRMPGMDGDELLAEVRRRHPLTVRLVLTGQCSREAMMRLVSLAHRVLTKPCDPAQLKAVVQRACSLRGLLRAERLAEVVTRLGSVPTLPTVYTRLVEELERPEPSFPKISEFLTQDVGVAAKLMQVANSVMFAVRRPAATPADALRVLGTETTKTLVLAAGVFSRYDPAALHPFSIVALWSHSREVSELAGRIAAAEHADPAVGREAVLAGLVHDIGRLTLASQLPDLYKEVFRLMANDRLSVVAAEEQVFGATHAEVGAYLLGLWGLPDTLVEVVAFHHAPARSSADTFTSLTAVHAAEAILDPDEGGPADLVYLERLGLGERFSAWSGLRDQTSAS